MALPNIDINAGTPPILWSSVQEAFEKINENFIALDLATGGTAVDLSNLFTDIIPATTQTYQLGDQTHRWKSVHTGTWSEIPGSELNGLWAGASQIKGYKDGLDRNIIELPEGSTVAGNLIIDPDKTFFKSAQVDNELRIEANEFSDTLNLLSGTAIQLVVDSSGESIEFNNTGVISNVAGDGISVNSATGDVTITNTGVRSLQSTTALPSGRSTGAGINITAANGDNIRITNTGVLEVRAGLAINVSYDAATGIADINYTPGVAAPTSGFTTIAISGDNPVNNLQSDSTADTLTFAQGYGIVLTNNSTTDTMTIALNQRIDIIGSVFADNSTLLVDGVAGRIPAEVVQGTFTGSVVGNVSGNVSGTAGIATTVALVATESTAATHYVTFVDATTGNENVRTDSSLTYNPSTNTLTTTNFVGTITGNIFTNLIDSSDSSAITVTPATIFSSDVTVENDLSVTQRFLLRGSRVLNLTDLKAVVAASTSFSDFQARIAALV